MKNSVGRIVLLLRVEASSRPQSAAEASFADRWKLLDKLSLVLPTTLAIPVMHKKKKDRKTSLRAIAKSDLVLLLFPPVLNALRLWTVEKVIITKTKDSR